MKNKQVWVVYSLISHRSTFVTCPLCTRGGKSVFIKKKNEAPLLCFTRHHISGSVQVVSFGLVPKDRTKKPNAQKKRCQNRGSPTHHRSAGRQAGSSSSRCDGGGVGPGSCSVSCRLPEVTVGRRETHTHTHTHNNLQFIVQLHIYINYCRRGFLFLALIN